MTKRKASAPNQVELIRQLAEKIDASQYTFITDAEMTTGQVVLQGEWQYRLDTFINDPLSGVGSDEFERQYARALITRKYCHFLDKPTIAKYTRILKPPKEPEGTREQRLAKVKRTLKS